MEALLPKKHPKAVIIWGRFQPPHIGHGTIFAAAKAKYPNHDICVIPSLTCDMDTTVEYVTKLFSKMKASESSKKRGTEEPQRQSSRQKSKAGGAPPTSASTSVSANASTPVHTGTSVSASASTPACTTSSYPLTASERIQILSYMFPDPAFHFLNLNSNNIIDILTAFSKVYEHTVLYLGYDRVMSIPPVLKNVTFDKYADQFELTVNNKIVPISATKIRNALLRTSKSADALLRAALQHGIFKADEAAYQYLIKFLKTRIEYLKPFPKKSKR